MTEGYKKWASHYKEQAGKGNFYPENFVTRVFLSRSPVQFLDGDYERKTILDLGCGHGRNIPFLLNNGFEITGLEVSEQQVARLRDDFTELNFEVGVAENLPFDDDTFDYVLACNSIYYLTSAEACLNAHLLEAIRTLKPSGKLIFSMLGEQHSIFDGANKREDFVFEIKNDFLSFRDGVNIQVFHDDVESDIFNGLEILHHGEIIEKVAENVRHIHYFVAQSSK